MDDEKITLNMTLNKDARIEKLSEELKAAQEKMEALRAEKAELDLKYAARGGMIKAYEYALDAIARRDSKC